MFQPSLFGLDAPSPDVSFGGLERIELDDASWIDHAPGWLRGADGLVEQLADALEWGQRQVVMYDRLLAEPRLTSWWDTGCGRPEPVPVLAEARRLLSARYERPFDTIGFNLYRDGRDSVAWHGDRERFRSEEATVAIVSVGSPRSFLVRPRGGGRSRSWQLGHGDLLVMGGACQHHWEHCVPKVSRAAGPRLSIMFRHHLADCDEYRAGHGEV